MANTGEDGSISEPLDSTLELSPTGDESALDIDSGVFKKFDGNPAKPDLPSVEQRAAFHARGGWRPSGGRKK